MVMREIKRIMITRTLGNASIDFYAITIHLPQSALSQLSKFKQMNMPIWIFTEEIVLGYSS
jgi:hypothetical protein